MAGPSIAFRAPFANRFAREIVEGALNIPDHSWQFAAGSAHETEQKLKAAGRQLSGSIPGALGFYDDQTAGGQEVGHVVVCLPGGARAENTSGHRGNPSRPGTKITPAADVAASHGGAEGRWYWPFEVEA